MYGTTTKRARRARLLTWLAVGVTDRGWLCLRRLRAALVAADMEAALREGDARTTSALAAYCCPN